MREISSRIAYSADCEQMKVARAPDQFVELQAEYRTHLQGASHQASLGLRTDWGYFARFNNPLNENATVVLINGIHTAGVLGAARAFCERREALRNFYAAIASGVSTTGFECYFDVPVLNGQVKVPAVDSRNVFTLGRAEESITHIPISTYQRTSVAEGRTSVRILFIIGDRGGSQVNQLQAPKEYHAIQDALHACKHRDVITLSNPILGATRERLALAYRERPTIMHFAGHGNNRSLSIIEDHEILANETRLDADQLCNMLGTMQEHIRLFVLNACASLELANRLVGAGVVSCAIGWPAKVADSAAIAFSAALYGALGDGRSIGDAVAVAKVACGTADEPILVARDNTASDVLLVEGR